MNMSLNIGGREGSEDDSSGCPSPDVVVVAKNRTNTSAGQIMKKYNTIQHNQRMRKNGYGVANRINVKLRQNMAATGRTVVRCKSEEEDILSPPRGNVRAENDLNSSFGSLHGEVRKNVVGNPSKITQREVKEWKLELTKGMESLLVNLSV